MLNPFPAPDDENDLSVLEEIEQDEKRSVKQHRTAAYEPMITTLFKSVIRDSEVSAPDPVLRDFVKDVLTPLTDELEMSSAKGGAFYRMKAAEHAAQPDRNMRDPEHYAHDQTMRAHLLNGMLPALRIARYLRTWGAQRFFYWSEEAERLLIAGYLLHDYTKLDRVKAALHAEGFEDWHSPHERMMPALERIFASWCERFGLDVFLQPIGGVDKYLHDIIYIAHNTQVFKQTVGLPKLLPNKRLHPNTLMLVAEVSRLADLIAYTARTPRELVKPGTTLQKVLTGLAYSDETAGGIVARLTYHHVAENRGVLLNFIHEAALKALSNDFRVPFLYAPSGVVYLERTGAPPFPSPDVLIAEIVANIRNKAARQLIQSGKGARRGAVNLQVDDSYRDYFDLRQIVRGSGALVERLIRSNKSADRLAIMTRINSPGSEHIPTLPPDKTDSRLDRLAEWSGFLEVQLRERLDNPDLDLGEWLLPRLGVEDLLPMFRALRSDPAAIRASGGIKLWWFWTAAHVLDRTSITPEDTLELIFRLSEELADALPADLPSAAQVNETKWNDLADYLARVLTLGGEKTGAWVQRDEIARYTNAKKPRGGGSVCAICGESYGVTKPKETAVAFQPGVYTARVKLGSNDSSRSLCSICALEQLLRQLFVENLDSGRNVEDQRVRYLSFYPSYFFTPETLTLLREVYSQLTALRLGEGDLRRVLAEAIAEAVQETLTGFLRSPEKKYAPLQYPNRIWTRLTPFMLREKEEAIPKRLLAYSQSVGGTFFTFGLRNFDKPTDVEAWVVPTFAAFIFTVALDLKVVVSEGGIPLMTEYSVTPLHESDELPETLWLDGAHPAIRAVLDIGRTSPIDRLHVDEIVPALTRLTIAYLIHLDTEFNGRDEQWQRFPPLAHALAESPLYVFHYLIKQEREDSDHKAITRERTRRYLSYALLLADEKGKDAMSIARELVVGYRGFYRADNFKNSNSILRPVSVVADALLNAAVMPAFSDPEALYEVAYGELFKFMDRVSKGLADGRFPKGISAAERDQAMRAFCKLFVDDLFVRDFKRDAAALRGKPINLLKNACEVIYRELQYAEWSERGREADEPADDSE